MIIKVASLTPGRPRDASDTFWDAAFKELEVAVWSHIKRIGKDDV
jgi:hypothetical protein